MLTVILWLAMVADRYPAEFAVAVILTGPTELTWQQARWWAEDPFRSREYCRAANELGIVECCLDLRDLILFANDDDIRRTNEVRYSHRQLCRNIGRIPKD